MFENEKQTLEFEWKKTDRPQTATSTFSLAYGKCNIFLLLPQVNLQRAGADGTRRAKFNEFRLIHLAGTDDWPAPEYAGHRCRSDVRDVLFPLMDKYFQVVKHCVKLQIMSAVGQVETFIANREI